VATEIYRSNRKTSDSSIRVDRASVVARGDFLSHGAFHPPCNFDDAGAADAADVADAPVDHD
jgi:hypothetical protein